MNRAGHLQWAKDRALEYADKGETANAMSSLVSDLSKHEGTQGHAGIELMLIQAMAGYFDRPGELRKCIEGFQ